MQFVEAKRTDSRMRIALWGTSGSGKTYTALRGIFAHKPDAKVVIIDTEGRSSTLYVGRSPDGNPFKFRVGELADHSPASYTKAILSAAVMDIDFLVIDSLTHAWAGSGGALEIKDGIEEKNTAAAWRHVTPMHNRMIEAMVRFPHHLIVTMRAKEQISMEKNDKGKTEIKKLGLCPVQRRGIEYEFHVLAEVFNEGFLKIDKSRVDGLHKGSVDETRGVDAFRKMFDFFESDGELTSDYYYQTKEDYKNLLVKIEKYKLDAKKQSMKDDAEIKRMARNIEAAGGSVPSLQKFLGVNELQEKYGAEAVANVAKAIGADPNNLTDQQKQQIEQAFAAI